jgi:hypothetical protein
MFDLQLAVKGMVGYTRSMVQAYPVHYIYPGRMNQDPLENFFGHMRAKGRANTNPTAVQYGHRYQAMVVAKAVCTKIKKGNTGGSR